MDLCSKIPQGSVLKTSLIVQMEGRAVMKSFADDSHLLVGLISHEIDRSEL